MPAVIILVGLGNPGPKYAHHRHNVGFMAVDAIADAFNFGPVRKKFDAEVREGFLEGADGRCKAVALKPLTYMNESGRSVAEAMRYLNAEPGDVVVFHDELDLAAGKIRVKTGGGAAGHNGLRSISDHIGPDYRRVRIGIGHPGDKARVTGHVLGDFSKADKDWLEPLLGALASAAPMLLEGDARYSGEVGQRLASLRPAPPKKEDIAAPRDEKDAAPASQSTQKPTAPGGAIADALSKLLGRKE